MAPDGPPIRAIEQVPAREVVTSPSCRTLPDFGQNLVGALGIHPADPAGTTITLRYAEAANSSIRSPMALRPSDRHPGSLPEHPAETWLPSVSLAVLKCRA